MKIWDNDKAMIANAIGCGGCNLKYKRIILTSMVDDLDDWIPKDNDVYYYGKIKVNNPTVVDHIEIASVFLNDNCITFRDKMNDTMLFDRIKNVSGAELGLQFIGIKIIKL